MKKSGMKCAWGKCTQSFDWETSEDSDFHAATSIQIIYTGSPHTTNKQSTKLPTFFPSGEFQGFNNIIPPMRFKTSKPLEDS
jgi:hypothetical protein